MLIKLDLEKYRDEQIIRLGFAPSKLTFIQKDVLLEPIDAPENYDCGGELSPYQAKVIWQRRMFECGFNQSNIKKAAKNLGI